MKSYGSNCSLAQSLGYSKNLCKVGPLYEKTRLVTIQELLGFHIMYSTFLNRIITNETMSQRAKDQ